MTVKAMTPKEVTKKSLTKNLYLFWMCVMKMILVIGR
ncbi:Hypothetical protein A7A1_0816 [Bacillus subtilis subsp. subtilis str. BSP1]|nr:Hypothetical protein A7A1_0816 [Bacillus subtilis subsp. subtilis str. BSP1]BAA12362.1 YrkG [Bacillus subtilis]